MRVFLIIAELLMLIYDFNTSERLDIILSTGKCEHCGLAAENRFDVSSITSVTV